MSKMKYCTGCKCEHPIEAFGKLKQSPDGYNWRCKAWIKEHYGEKHTPIRGVEKVCPSCNKHIDVDPTLKEGACSKCGVLFCISPSWSSKHGIRLWTPKSENLSVRVISYIREHPGCYQAQAARGAKTRNAQRAVSKLENDGLVITRREQNKVFLEVPA